jgi:hypothetical protein
MPSNPSGGTPGMGNNPSGGTPGMGNNPSGGTPGMGGNPSGGTPGMWMFCLPLLEPLLLLVVYQNTHRLCWNGRLRPHIVFDIRRRPLYYIKYCSSHSLIVNN